MFGLPAICVRACINVYLFLFSYFKGMKVYGCARPPSDESVSY